MDHHSYTVLATSANEAMRGVHERMPVILAANEFATWLSRDRPPEALHSLFRPCDPSWLKMHPVSKAVGNIRNDSADLIAPLFESKSYTSLSPKTVDKSGDSTCV